MLDPLQNILHCADMIRSCRSLKPKMTWATVVGEMDHVCEIQRQMEQIRSSNTLQYQNLAMEQNELYKS